MGPRWVSLQTTARIHGLESAAARSMDFWSIHGPLGPSAFWSDDLGPALAATRSSAPLPDLIIGADWNALPDPSRDCLFGRQAACPWHPIGAVLAPHLLIDVARHLRPEDRRFSRVTTGPSSTIKSAKRLDSVWTTPALLPFATPARYTDTSSDHRAVTLKFDFGTPPNLPDQPFRRPFSRWTLHPGVLRDPSFRRAIESFCTDLTPPPGPLDQPPTIPWSEFERRLRTVAMIESRVLGRSLSSSRASIRDLGLRLERLDLTSPSSGSHLHNLLSALSTARLLAQDSASMDAINPASAGVFRPSTWMSRANEANGGAQITSLLNAQGHSGHTESHLLSATHIFFQTLYTSLPPSPPRFLHATLLLTHCSVRLQAADIDSLSLPFSPDELLRALRTSSVSAAPGPNGLTYPLLRLAGPTVVLHLAPVANAMRAGHPLSVRLRTSLLHKGGPRNNLSHYRPISVSDTHIRVLSRAAAGRLQTAISHTLPWYQAAFMPGRRTSTIIGALQGLADHSCLARPGFPSSFVVIFLDQQKAYDRVDRAWLWAVLAHIGAPASFVTFLQSLYADPATQVLVNGALTSLIILAAGLLQGDPLSCSLYNIALQPFLDFLAHLQVGLHIPGLGLLTSLAFADDVTLVLPLGIEGLHQWHLVLHALHVYESAAGARLNRSKCGFFTVTRDPDALRDDPLLTALRASELTDLQPENGEVSHLGHPVQLGAPGSPCPVTFAARIAAISNRIDLMATSGTDLLLRVRLCNSLLTPMLWHHSSVGGLPANAGLLVRQALRRFLFKGERSWIDHGVICHPRHLGGLGLIDPDSMFTAQSISFLAHHVVREDCYGLWLRDGLAWTLHHEYGCSPAIFLAPGTVAHKLIIKTARSKGFWGRLIHALGSVAVSLQADWPKLPTVSLLELPWSGIHFPAATLMAVPGTDTTITAGKIRQIQNRGWLTWADILWRTSAVTSRQPMQLSWPLGPPGPQDTTAHHVPRPTHAKDCKGPQLGLLFGPLWAALPHPLQSSLLRAQLLPFAAPTVDARARPLIQDPLARHFPWTSICIDNVPLAAITVRQVRLARFPSPVCVDWKDGVATSASDWEQAFTELHRVPLPSAAISHCYMWMNRRSWLARTTDAVAPCPLCLDDTPENQAHAYVSCPAIQNVWHLARPILLALGIPDLLAMDPRSVALGWPEVKTHRHRLILWRTAIIHHITLVRGAGLRRFRLGEPFHITFAPPPVLFSQVVALVAEGIHTSWDTLRRRPTLTAGQASKAFDKRWVDGSSLVRRRPDSDDRLIFSPPAPDSS
ncbi:hypothetical protein CF319_g7929 [Tilletia indica]|nr:hypothetical protein CF319_g7929 [Tilletia indica]